MCRRRSSLGALVLALCLLALASPVALAGPPTIEQMLAADHLPGELLVKFRDDAPEPAMRSLRVQLAARIGRHFRSGAEHWLLGPGHSVEEALRTLIGHPLVAYAEPNYRVFPVRAPNDPRYPELWGLNNTGQQGGTPGADIDAERAWDISTGDRRVRVAVIDTGIEASHPELAAQIWTNPGEIPANGLDDDGNGFVDDVHGWDFCADDNDPADDDSHGTHVAGTIGGLGNDGFGVAGVAWSVTIVPIKFLCWGSGSTEDAIAAIEYATLLGVDVMNNSWGGGGFSQAMLDAINAAAQQEILFVAAAGNYNSDNDLWPFYPASLDAPNILAVAATDRADGRAWFSNWGAQSVDLGAPGVDILSAVMGGSHGLKNGTSMATPHVSGVAALMRAIAPEMGVVALKRHLLESVEPVSSMSGITVTGGRLNAFRALSAVDDVPPAAVADLAVEATTSGSVSLVWTAPGDDGDQGTARAYDLRYSTAPIDGDNFAAATPATAPAPQPAGSREQTEVGGLDAATLYYFALVSSDESGTASPLSNVASGTTLDPPTIATSPPSFSASLITGAVSGQILTIENVGVGSLDWVIPPPDPGEPPPPGAAEELTLAKGQPDPRQGPAPASSGGPDPYGYRFVDSDEPDGPAFDWVDISATGTPIESLTGDDQSSGAIPIGFPFDFYGTPFESVNVATNGFLSFTNAGAGYNNQPLPSGMAPEFLIAPFWDDLDFGGQVRASYLADGSSFTIQFTNVAQYGGDGVYTFQVSLYPHGRIVFRYQSMVGRVDSATIGIQDGTQTQGLQVAFNAPYVHDGLAIRIDRTPDWLRATPTAGRLWSGERAEVAVTIDAARLLGGHYDGVLTVLSNDPLRPAIPHAVSLDVTAAPDIAVSPATLDFGEVFLGGSRTLPFAVENAGTAPLQVASIGSDRPEFVPDRTALTLSPFARENVAVSFAPGEIDSFEGILTLASDDPDEPVTTVRLTGVGVAAPIIGVDPAELDATLNQFVQETLPLTVSNSGGSALDFTAEVVPRGPGLQRVAFVGLSAGDGQSNEPEPSMSDAEQAEPPPFRGADASFEPLPPSPVPLTCVAGDIAGHAIYARALSGYGFYRFRSETGAWERLADFPTYSDGAGGAALLGGTIYISYAAWGTELGVYDIAADRWTTRPHPLSGGTANVASDGERYLYFVQGQRLVRYDPVTLEAVDLAAPPFAFEPWGGLAYVGGRLYGHTGSGRSEFAVYDVAGNTWRVLPALPAGAVLGAAIDPLAQEYAAVGPYGGTNLYRFSLTDETWTVSTLPFSVYDGGLTWLPGQPAGLYIVQGEYGTGFTRLVGAPAWLRVAPDAGSVAAGETVALDVTFDSNLLLGGDYGATIEIRSNDPLTPLVEVPADLIVVGVPDIVLSGPEQLLESAIDYTGYGALTQHALAIVVPPAGDGSIELVADGDYGYYYDRAAASAEGLQLGSVGGTGSNCVPVSGFFPIGATDLLALATDGVVRVDVQNSYGVDPYCTVNRHTVRLRYRGAADRLDFGALFVGLSRTLEIAIANHGSSPLEISSIASDRPEFVPSLTTLSLAPRASAVLTVTFTPAAVQSFDGTLTFTSNDPDEPVTTVRLTGLGVEPALIGVDPAELDATLNQFVQETLPLTVSNSGGSALDFTAEVVPRGPGLQRVAFVGLSAGDGRSNEPEPSMSDAEQAEPPPFRGADASFEPLRPSPVPLTCVAGDIAGHAIYARALSGYDFYRFRSETGAWERLADFPTYSYSAGGAALLGGTIYISYAAWGMELGVYDIATDRWTTRPHPLSGGTANVASDGERYLYFVQGQQLVRYEPATLAAVDLAAPPFAFEPWGGLAYSGGRLYGHAGSGRSEFAVYDVAGNTWRQLPALPAGAVLGAAIDPLAQEYAAVGPYGGRNLYRFSLTDETWTVSTLPFDVRAGGLAWLPGRPAGLYIVQGEYGTGFTRLVGAPAWLRVAPDAGSVAAGETVALDVTFDSNLLLGGDYGATIEIRSNDPLTPLLEVPADLTVIGVPDIVLGGAEQQLESAIDYTGYGALTQHAFPIVVAPVSDGSIELVAEGEFGDYYERATASAEGLPLGSVGYAGWDCAPASGRFAIGASNLLALAADGVVRVDVQNDYNVDPSCAINRHTVRLRYRGAADRVDFGAQYVGQPRTLEIMVSNRGSSPLEISSIASDSAEFVASQTSLSLAPHTSAMLAITFTPGAVQSFDGSLTLESNDPDEAVTVVTLSGLGVEPPIVGVDPAELDATLDEGTQQTLPLTVSNSGASALDFTAEVVPRGPGLQRMTFTGLSAGDGRSDNPEPSVSGADRAEPPPFRGEAVSFEPLPASAAPLTCVAGDVAGRAVYAQENQGRRFYRFRSETGAWEGLADAPLYSGNNGGAALLGGTIYASYTDVGTQLGVYDIATDSWTTRSHPLGGGTADVASDGEQYLYFVQGQRLVRYEPVTLEAVDLATPPFAFEPWGGLAYSRGRLYGHAGNGRSEFAVYDVAHDSWRQLPALPAGAVLGAAIDPLAQEYAAVGPHGGANLYRFSLTDETWTVSTLPFAVRDGGLAWLPGQPAGLYLVQGEYQTGFTRLVGAPTWLRVAPDAGSVAAGETAALDVTFDSSLLLGGDYGATIEIRSNDPLTPLLEVPADLTVIGVPDIEVRGVEQQLESAVDYTVYGALTQHAFPIVVAPASDGSVELLAEGEYGNDYEQATMSTEGLQLGSVGATGSYCAPATGRFPVGAADLLALAADGVVRVDVQNSYDVGLYCAINRHTVRLRYRGAADRLDFGVQYVGLPRILEIEVKNRGSSPLEISSIASDRPEFVPSVTSLKLASRASTILALTFTPGAVQSFDGALTLASNDPDEAVTTVALTGLGVEAPLIGVDPAELDARLDQGTRVTLPLAVSNSGGGALDFAMEIVPRGPALQRVKFAGLSAGDGPSNDPESAMSSAERTQPTPFRGADATFEPLPASPVSLTCVVGDVVGRAVYAQASSSYYFYRFRPDRGIWEHLADAPIYSGNNGGAALLGGAIYTSYTSTDSPLGIYDIVSNSWTTRPHPLGGGTANVASDGERYLYLVQGQRLVRYDPVTSGTTSLASPPFSFDPVGGLAYSDGRLYGHAGNGRSEFAVYDVAGDMWRRLPSLPAGAELGAAIDSLAQEYAAVGPYGGTNLYRFSLTNETWTVSTLPFAVGGGGLAWLPGQPAGLYIAQGGYGTQFTRLVGAPAWLRVTPDAGSVPAGATAILDVAFDGSLLLGGDYGATIEIRSNDPATPLVEVPADLIVVGVPDIALSGSEQLLESAIDYTVYGALTQHALAIVVPPAGDGSIELVADGDYGYYYDRATASAEGLQLGSVGGTGRSCVPMSGFFPIGAADLLALATDGVVRVDVQNSYGVDPYCAVNRHTVRLRYRAAADPIDFGALFVGLSRTLEIEVRNAGTSWLEVSSITSDRPEFVVSPTSLSLAPRASATLAITFTPGAVQSFDGTLTFTSNDPDEPVTTVRLTGLGVEPPLIGVDPAELDATLNQFVQETLPLTVSNSGGSALDFTAEVVPRGPGLQRVAFVGLSAGDGQSNEPEPSMSDAEQAEPPPFRGADASFEPLPPSPVPLTCVAGDIAGHAIYARALSGYDFYRFRSETGAWERLADFPTYSYSAGGAALLGGTIYISYAAWGMELGVYDIATDRWTTRPHPLSGGRPTSPATGSGISTSSRGSSSCATSLRPWPRWTWRLLRSRSSRGAGWPTRAGASTATPAAGAPSSRSTTSPATPGASCRRCRPGRCWVRRSIRWRRSTRRSDLTAGGTSTASR